MTTEYFYGDINESLLSTEHFEEVSKMETTSARVRYLAENGFKKYTISKILNIRPQHVYNVLAAPPKKRS